jgi:hypothetical protein
LDESRQFKTLKFIFKSFKNNSELEVIALSGDDPDGAGPAESQLT